MNQRHSSVADEAAEYTGQSDPDCGGRLSRAWLSSNDHLSDNMMPPQDPTHLGFPQFVNDPVLDMPSLISESQMCGSLSSYNPTAHGFCRTAAISQGFQSLESTMGDILSVAWTRLIIPH
jgi:hypothetical protein